MVGAGETFYVNGQRITLISKQLLRPEKGHAVEVCSEGGGVMRLLKSTT